jgi:hypothetical protein
MMDPGDASAAPATFFPSRTCKDALNAAPARSAIALA